MNRAEVEKEAVTSMGSSSSRPCSSVHHGSAEAPPATWLVDFENIFGEVEADRDIAYCSDCYRTDVLEVESLRMWASNQRQI